MAIERIDRKFARLCADADAFDIESSNVVFITEDDVVPDMRQHSANFRTWALMAQLAYLRYNRMKDQLKKVLADCKIQARKDLELAKKKITDASSEELALLNPLYFQVQEQFREAEFIWGKFSAVEEALQHHRDMLRSINSRQNKDWDSDDYKSASFESMKNLYHQTRGE